MDNLKAHTLKHIQPQYKCKNCSEEFSFLKDCEIHEKTHQPKRKAENNIAPLPKRGRKVPILNTFAREIFVPDEENKYDFILCFNELGAKIIQFVQEELIEKRAVKWRIIVKAQLSRTSRDGVREEIVRYFSNKHQTQLIADDIADNFEYARAKVITAFENFLQEGSNWVLDYIISVEVPSSKYTPFAGSSYMELPDKIKKKKAVLNIMNDDNKCFIYCLLAHMLKVDDRHANRVSEYTSYTHLIKMGSVSCPVAVSQVPVVERLNNLRINIFGLEKCSIFPLYISKRENNDCINLLLMSDETNQHYCLINNMSRLLVDESKHDGQRYPCMRCLHIFSREDLLNDHEVYCKDFSAQHVAVPLEGKNILKFKNINYQHPIPYIVYADFESILIPSPNIDTSEKLMKHEACGYGYVIVGPNGKTYKTIQVYRGPDAATHFVSKMLEEMRELTPKICKETPIKMTPYDEIKFRMATHCSVCEGELGEDRVREHDHITGCFRGACHNSCNLQYRMRKILPVVFHNLKNYDGHLIVKSLNEFKDCQFNLIAQNMEKYITFSIKEKEKNEEFKVNVSLQFIDSLQFLPTSLQKLVKNLKEDQFGILKENIHHQHLGLLLQKGVYPYEFMNDFNKFDETQLPPKEAFFSTLTDENISDEEYDHAQKVWDAFDIRTLGQYHDLYVRSDVLQLADVFENFRKICAKNYGIDPAHLLTAAGLAWQASLKQTQQSLELFTNVDMHLFIEKGIRGGISTITKRYAIANNKYMDNYVSSKPSNYILYLDANNLYGWAMCEPLPYAEFKWVAPEMITQYFISTIPEHGEVGYIFEVDLEYPEELHDLHSDYPLAPEKFTVKENMLSKTAKEIWEQTSNAPFHEYEKLTPNLYDKENYIVHYRNLQLYLELGLKLKKVHRVLSFKQKAWLEPYISYNTEQRKAASSPFERDFFKFMNNSVFGKTMENVRKRKDVRLINTEESARKLVASPTFQSFKDFGDELVAVQRLKKKILLNRPLYVGFSILELSKVHMYKFHYGFIKKKYGNKAELLFTDTDSLTYDIQTDDIYEDMLQNKNLFDTSDYEHSHRLYSVQNKKVIGKFKDELNGKLGLEFIGLRSKMYSLLSEYGQKNAAKGVSRAVITQKLKHDSYRECLMNKQASRETMKRIQSDCHELFTVQQQKITLSPFDDKRFILPDGIHTYAYGHFKIKKIQEEEAVEI